MKHPNAGHTGEQCILRRKSKGGEWTSKNNAYKKGFGDFKVFDLRGESMSPYPMTLIGKSS